MPKEVKTKKRIAKERRWGDLQDACCTYSKCLFVEVDNVTSKQISIMRKELRKMDAKMIMGKNVSRLNTPYFKRHYMQIPTVCMY